MLTDVHMYARNYSTSFFYKLLGVGHPYRRARGAPSGLNLPQRETEKDYLLRGIEEFIYMYIAR